MIKLLPHQKPHVPLMIDALAEHNICLDSSSTGAGKTFMALAVADYFQVSPLVVCPKTARGVWEEAAERTGAAIEGPIHYERLLADAKQPGREARGVWAHRGRTWQWTEPLPSLIIFDESHRLTGRDSQTSKMLMACRDQEVPTLMLSATPFYSPLKMRAMAYAFGLTPNPLASTFYGWCLQQDCYYGNFNQLTWSGTPTSWDRIKQALGPRMVGLDKNRIPGFPEVQVILETVPVTNDPDAIYERLQALLEEAETGGVEQIRLRQLAEHGKIPAIIEKTKDLKAQGHAVPIFVNYKETARELAKKLKAPVIDGDTPGAERGKAILDFQEGRADVLVLTLATGGTSINLHDEAGHAPRASILCPGDDPTLFVQALGRIHRAGSRSKATQYIFFARGSKAEQRVKANLKAKLNALSSLTDADLNVLTQTK